MLFWVPTRRSPEAAKGWLLLIFFLPWLGMAIYWLIGRPYAPRWRIERIKQLAVAMRPIGERLRKHPNMVHPSLTPELETSVTLAENMGRLPILGGNEVELLGHYQASIEQLAADIEHAQHHVHLLYYIFQADEATEPVLTALERAAQRGVTCRVLVDALGSRSMSRQLFARLKPAGVQCHEMMPTGLFSLRAARTDLRNHRKLAVIDGRIGYTGSQNLIRSEFKEGITYEEMVVRVTGPVVNTLQFVFASDWDLETEEVLDSPELFPDPHCTGAVAAQVLPSGPTYAIQANQRIVVSLLHGARHRIVMTTPYFIPDQPLFVALQIAVLRGVEVHLIVSEKEDQFLVSQAQKSYYEDLLEVGVKIHLFQKKFLHAKHLTIDDQIALIGSSNMDIRSFVLNAEISLLCYDQEVTRQLHKHQERYFARSRALTLEEWTQRGYLPRLTQNLARLMSPLL
ncbi:MAG: cardiolipin synthase [Planctomycetia bacterium]|nr:cardiolipin synthase [Planctomycetia bacterium]